MTMREFTLQLMLLGWIPENLTDPRYQVYSYNVIYIITIVSGANSSPLCGFVRFHTVGGDGWYRDSFPNYDKALDFIKGDFDA